jgi:hypothetical protein
MTRGPPMSATAASASDDPDRGTLGAMTHLSRSFVIVAVAASGLTVAPEAGARCMAPSFVLTPSWGKVPAKPVLELMVPAWRFTDLGALPRLVSSSNGQASVAFTVKPDTSTDALKTFRVEVTGAVTGPLALDLVDTTGAKVESWSLEVDPAWKPPAGSLAPIKVGHVSQRWVCSHTRTANLAFDGDAWAYRIVAATSRRDLAQGKTREFVVPRSMGLFFGRGSAAGPLPEVDVALGYANCFGNTFEWAGSVVANVLALLPDGTEQPVNSGPLAIGVP